ncbi:hypothetical protein [Nonomuraea sp. NPDC002799]
MDSSFVESSFAEPAGERAGSLVLRAWLEGGQPDRLRVRVLSSIGQDQAPPLAVTSPEAVHAAVQSWLEQLLNRPDDVSVTES